MSEPTTSSPTGAPAPPFLRRVLRRPYREGYWFYSTVKQCWRARESLRDFTRRLRLLVAVRRHTMVGPGRLNALYSLVRQVDSAHVPGAIVQCGVWNGGSAGVLARASGGKLERDLWLFDSFLGLPEPGERDGAVAQGMGGELKADPARVAALLRKLRVPDNRVHIVAGWFQDTFPKVNIPDIALLHIDADWYESVKLCLERFYESVSPSGIVVLDDYGYWQGCRQAVEEFFQARRLSHRLVPINDIASFFRKE